MGNAFSEEGEDGADGGSFLENGFKLNSPEADKQINFGTAAPNCQPRHTMLESSKQRNSRKDGDYNDDDDDEERDTNNGSTTGTGQEVTMDDDDHDNDSKDDDGSSGDKNKRSSSGGRGATHQTMTAKHRRDSSTSASGNNVGDHRGHKRQHLSSSSQQSHQRESSTSSQLSNGSQHSNSSQNNASSSNKKLSYIQMAKLGYQELVNAIIRPPRAEYKVNVILLCFFFGCDVPFGLRRKNTGGGSTREFCYILRCWDTTAEESRLSHKVLRKL